MNTSFLNHKTLLRSEDFLGNALTTEYVGLWTLRWSFVSLAKWYKRKFVRTISPLRPSWKPVTVAEQKLAGKYQGMRDTLTQMSVAESRNMIPHKTCQYLHQPSRHMKGQTIKIQFIHSVSKDPHLLFQP